MAQTPMTATSGLAELRHAFDIAFSMLPTPSEELEDLLALRVAGDVYVVRVCELSGLMRLGRIVPLPSRDPALLGIAGVRGTVVPVFSLSACLGYGRTREPDRWMLLCGRQDDTFALAFAEIDRHLQVRLPNVRMVEGASASRPHTRGVALTDAGAHTVVDLRSLSDAMRTRAAADRNKER